MRTSLTVPREWRVRLGARAKNYARRERRFSAVTLVCRSLKSGRPHSQNLLISPNRPGNYRKSDETTEPADTPARVLLIAME